MYVARLGGPSAGFIVKRMPESGSRHAIDCPSYEPPPGLSGLGQVLGSAIVEDPATGQTTLKLDFPLTRRPGRSTPPPPGGEPDSVKSAGTRLSLRALLHYLWDQAALTRWHPGFAGKRSWAIVRRHLLDGADNKVIGGDPLRARLYIPEPFAVEQRDAINARRQAHWSHALARPGQPAQRMILIAEVKKIVPARYGFRAIIKHLPDQAFSIDERLYRRLERRFEAELRLWGTNDGLRMVAIATFLPTPAGIPSIEELSLMPDTGQWLPLEDEWDRQLTARLVDEGRTFIKPLHYNLPTAHCLPAAVLTDTDQAPTALLIERAPRAATEEGQQTVQGTGLPTWCWRAPEESMPPFPSSRGSTAGS